MEEVSEDSLWSMKGESDPSESIISVRKLAGDASARMV